jgi:hypothetical protein
MWAKMRIAFCVCSWAKPVVQGWQVDGGPSEEYPRLGGFVIGLNRLVFAFRHTAGQINARREVGPRGCGFWRSPQRLPRSCCWFCGRTPCLRPNRNKCGRQRCMVEIRPPLSGYGVTFKSVTSRESREAGDRDRFWRWSQPVDATLYPETERCGLWRLVKDIFEAS